MRNRLLAAVIAVAATLGSATVLSSTRATPVVRVRPMLGPRVLVSPTRQPPTTDQCERSSGTACYSPDQIRQAYDLNALYAQHQDGTGRTIAVVDPFGSPSIRSDLEAFDSGFGIPPPPNFRIVHPAGRVPRYSPGKRDRVEWAFETTLDVEWAHAIAPGANILLVVTPTDETEGTTGFPDIVRAENVVIDRGLADVISQSFGATEATFRSPAAIRKLRSAFKNARAHHVSVLAATGDTGATSWRIGMHGYYAFRVSSWPATDPLVTAVGGTQLHLDAEGNRTQPDNAWNDTNDPAVVGAPPVPTSTGGGLSKVFARPDYQNGLTGIVGGARGVPDVSLSAACDGGVLIYIGIPGGPAPGYYSICGTSESTPLFAGVVAIADQVAGHSLGTLNPKLYVLAAQPMSGIVDVTGGSNTVSFEQNGRRHTVRGFTAVTGYDLATGLGTVDAAELVAALTH